MSARPLILLLLLLVRLGAADGAPAAAAPAAPAPGKAALIVLDTEIDEALARYYHRALRQAIEAGCGTVVVQITSPGGYLHVGLDMLDTALAAKRDHPDLRLVAFVDGKAWSAAAMIAYGHRQIWLTPGAHIGDIGIYSINQDGSFEYAPEKFESPVRAHLRSSGEANGWDTAKLQKMTARNQELYRFDLADGKHFILEDDLGRFLADHPDAKAEQKVLVLGKDRFISYTAREAVADGMATGIVKDLDELWTTLGVDRAQVIDLRPTRVERVSWAISGYAAILASLAVLCVIMELKAPGMGLWTVLAGIFGAAFFVCQYYQDLAGNLELVLVGLGVVAMVVELFVFHTGGLLGFSGLAVACAGLVMAFMPDEVQFSVGSAEFARALVGAVEQSLLAFVMIAVGVGVVITVLPRSRAMRRIAATAEIAGTSAGALEGAAPALIGRTVKALSDLRPAGQVVIDGDAVSASTEHGEYVAAGTAVEIVAMRFGEAIVRPLPGAQA